MTDADPPDPAEADPLDAAEADAADPTEAGLEFLLGSRERADAMADRLRRTADWRGLGRPDAMRLADCFLSAMRHRAASIRDDHHPDYLHPARTALILLDDAGVRDPAVLFAAVLQDTSRPDLAMPADEVERIGGPAAAAVIRLLPSPEVDPREIMELLVTLPPGVLALYLAAQLDHVRHLHLGDRSRWRDGHTRVTDGLIPLAHRCHPTLARRFERWAGAFRRRFLEAGP